MLSISIFSDLTQKFIDNILVFKNRKQEQNEKLFHEFIEPLYKELELVADDYFKIFRQTQIIVRANVSGIYKMN
jgi:hypothetical protein